MLDKENLSSFPREIYVYKKLIHKCPFCRSGLIQAKAKTKKDKIYDLGLEVCEKCNKGFSNPAFYSENKEYFLCMNLEQAEALVEERNLRVETKRKKATGIKLSSDGTRTKKQIYAMQVANYRRRKSSSSFEIQTNRKEELDKRPLVKKRMIGKIPTEWNSVFGYNTEALNDALMKVSLSCEELNSIFAAFLVNDYNNELRCIFLSTECKEFNVAEYSVSIANIKRGSGYSLLESIKAKKTFYYDQDKNINNVIDAAVIYEPEFKNYVGKVNLKTLYKKKAASINIPANNETYDYDSNKCVYVFFRLTNTCVKKNHKIETVTAKTYNAKNSNPIKVNVFHCTQCDRYFINYEALQEYISKGIFPALSYKLIRDISGELNEASQLMLYGYNVREGNLSGDERQNILSWIIDSGLMTKAEIIKDLQFKVRYNGSKAGNERAKIKWQDDIQFVSQYVIDNNREIQAEFVSRR